MPTDTGNRGRDQVFGVHDAVWWDVYIKKKYSQKSCCVALELDHTKMNQLSKLLKGDLLHIDLFDSKLTCDCWANKTCVTFLIIIIIITWHFKDQMRVVSFYGGKQGITKHQEKNEFFISKA